MKYNLKEMAEFINKDYKQMEYQEERKKEVLLDGYFKNYKFYILNLGTHPTAYIEIPRNSELFGKGYDEIYEMGLDLEVHGGLTYADESLLEDEKSWFIGWDYAHYNDWSGYNVRFPEDIRGDGKKWTTEEIFNDVCCAIDQILEYRAIDKSKYDEIINGNYTYKKIARDLKNNKSVIIGWTDEEFTHFDIYFSLKNINQYGNLQRGIKKSDLFVGIVSWSFYGFKTDTQKYESYICEKLRLNQSETTKKLTELINGIIREIGDEEIEKL